jgi:hypothetical protein
MRITMKRTKIVKNYAQRKCCCDYESWERHYTIYIQDLLNIFISEMGDTINTKPLGFEAFGRFLHANSSQYLSPFVNPDESNVYEDYLIQRNSLKNK